MPPSAWSGHVAGRLQASTQAGGGGGQAGPWPLRRRLRVSGSSPDFLDLVPMAAASRSSVPARLRRPALLAAVLLLGGCAGHARLTQPANTALPPADPVAALMNRPEYRIGPSDLLEVTLFQVEDLDREVRVNNAGQITLPLIGVVQAGGQTVDELEHTLAGCYRARFLQDPQVTVFVKEFASQRVTVTGEVKKPGIYPMTSARLSLMQALAMAEGFSNIGSRRNVFIFRTVDGQRMLARFDMNAIARGEYPDPEISGEDIVLVQRSRGREAVRTLIELTPFVAVWRAYR